MTLTRVGSTQAVLNHHLECFGNGDVDGILSDYGASASGRAWCAGARL